MTSNSEQQGGDSSIYEEFKKKGYIGKYADVRSENVIVCALCFQVCSGEESFVKAIDKQHYPGDKLALGFSACDNSEYMALFELTDQAKYSAECRKLEDESCALVSEFP